MRRALAIVALLALVPVLVVGLLLLAPVRNAILSAALPRVVAALPGRLEIARSAWPAPGRLELDDVRWTDDADTLVAAERLVVDANLAALTRRDLQVRELEVLGLHGDLAALAARFASGGEPGEESGASRGKGFPRAGALARLPSVSVGRVRVEASDVVVSPELRVRDVAVTAGAELRAGHAPRLDVQELRLEAVEPELRIVEGRLSLDLEPGEVEASVRATWAGRDLSLDIAALADERLQISALATENGSDLLRLESAVRLEREGLIAVGAELAGTLHLHGAADPVTLDPVHVSWEKGTVVVDTLEAVLSDLRLAARGSVAVDSLDARVELTASGTRWLAVLAPEATAPDSLALELRASAAGPSRGPRVNVELAASAGFGGFRVDRLDLVAEMPEDGTTRLTLSAIAHGLRTGLDAEIEREPLAARLSPIRVRDADAAPVEESASLSGRAAAEEDGFLLDAVQVVGVLGDLELSGRLAGGAGSFDVAWSCPEAPPALGRLAPDSTLAASLRTEWAADGVPFLKITGEVAPAAGGARIDASGRFSLPGPHAFEPLLPANADVDGLGNLRGEFAGFVETAARVFDVGLDLEETDWLQAGRVVARGAGGNVEIDTLALAVEGAAIEGGGALGDSLRFDGSVVVDGLSFARRFLGAGADELDADLRAGVRLSGTRDAPRAEATIEGAATLQEHEVRDLNASADWQAGRLEADASFAAELSGGRIALDRVAVGFVSTGDSLWPARTRLEIDGHAAELRQTLVVANDSVWTLGLEELIATWDERSLQNRAPATIVVVPGGRITVEGLRLDGDLGLVEATGVYGPEELRGEARVACRLPAKPDFARVPANLWPDSVVVELDVPSDREVHVRVGANGLTLANHENLAVLLTVDGADSSLAAVLRVEEGGTRLVDGKLDVPAFQSLRAGSLVVTDEPMHGRITIEGLRLPSPSPDEPRSFVLGGAVELGGRPSRPEASGELLVSFPEWPLLEDHELVVRAAYDSGAVSASIVGTDPEGVERIRGDAHLPAGLSLWPASFDRRSEEPMRAEVHLDEVRLRRIGPLLPDGTDIGGVLDLDFVAEGPAAEVRLDGHLAARALEISAANGSRVLSDANLEFGGTSARPAIDGEIVVSQGEIHIPEASQVLHPLEGAAMLWESDWKPPVDSLAIAQQTADTAVAHPADLNVRVIVPGQVWIRGRNMMFELAGDLALAQSGGAPTVTGELRTLRGRMIFVGRRFDVQRGEVRFFGDDELDPSLDIALRTVLSSKTFWIEVTGTARKPKLALRSEPDEMSEGDIIAYLLFGSSMSDLDGGQEELMARLAGAYASAELNERLSGTGVDIVSLDAGDKERGSSLTVGKYLSQKMLVSYEQALDDVAESLLNVEYLLTQRIRVGTLYGNKQSGVELRWENDY